MIYMDSNNVPMLCLSDKGISDYVKEQEEKRKAVKGRGYQNWKRNVIQQAYIDQRGIVDRISSYVSGESDMVQETVSSYVNKMLSSFNNHVEKSLISGDPDFYIPLLLSWLESHYPVKVLRDNLLPFISDEIISYLVEREKKSSSNDFSSPLPLPLSQLKDWAIINHLRLVDLCPTPLLSFGLEQVDSFTSLLSTMLDKL